MLGDIDPKAALEIYRQRFADVGDFTFIIVCNFEPAEIEPYVRTYLGGLPSGGRRETWRDIGVQRPEGVVEVEVENGLEPKAHVSLLFSGDAEWSREDQHQISSLARILRIRLREVLREDLGATYGTSVSGSISWRPKERSQVSISFGCAPEEVDSLVATVFAEIERLKTDGVEADDIAKIQEIQRRQRETQLKENGFWLRGLQSYYTHGLDPRLLLAFDELIDSVTGDSLQQAARKFIDPERYVLGVLSPAPEADAEAAGEAAGGR